jgi:hypothetical protein
MTNCQDTVLKVKTQFGDLTQAAVCRAGLARLPRRSRPQQAPPADSCGAARTFSAGDGLDLARCGQLAGPAPLASRSRPLLLLVTTTIGGIEVLFLAHHSPSQMQQFASGRTLGDLCWLARRT